MPIGPGKYDRSLTDALKDCGAKQGVLIVLDGNKGPSFCCQLSFESAIILPQMLRDLANQIERSYSEGKL